MISEQHTNGKKRVIFFGDPERGAQNCIQVASKPNRLQRWMLRKLLNLYFYEYE